MKHSWGQTISPGLIGPKFVPTPLPIRLVWSHSKELVKSEMVPAQSSDHLTRNDPVLK